MLTVTEAAAEAITALTAQQGAEESGLRFALQSMENEGAQLALSVAPAPEDGDRVVGTDGGAKVFLEPQAAALLDDKVLDVQQDESGDVAFAVLPQQSL
ncbi:iron-sulfur cluster biosynthesis protein [Amycolatopsis saalfeldensis]|uniref:Fe-S cluster assembly iron-binding protein IscA n=1 Tax=Amycolatopsis saalfeldensis TaxID=394193 RepID=A0A1H8YHB2_9PSEU|nr:iron-sulfur cluster biosynthesis protein [Amycolatopsis saalfeldensis]SEP51549.1 Fe-S cluster assembly iron-binding protein IscA [Amycolatopsis saalfeldensis]